MDFDLGDFEEVVCPKCGGVLHESHSIYTSYVTKRCDRCYWESSIGREHSGAPAMHEVRPEVEARHLERLQELKEEEAEEKMRNGRDLSDLKKRLGIDGNPSDEVDGKSAEAYHAYLLTDEDAVGDPDRRAEQAALLGKMNENPVRASPDDVKQHEKPPRFAAAVKWDPKPPEGVIETTTVPTSLKTPTPPDEAPVEHFRGTDLVGRIGLYVGAFVEVDGDVEDRIERHCVGRSVDICKYDVRPHQRSSTPRVDLLRSLYRDLVEAFGGNEHEPRPDGELRNPIHGAMNEALEYIMEHTARSKLSELEDAFVKMGVARSVFKDVVEGVLDGYEIRRRG